MLPRPRGYNHDVRYRGQVFHIQSEVCGGSRQQVRTQLFSRGAVLATERSPLDEGAHPDGVEALLREQHKSVLRELCRGTFDAWLAGGVDVAEPEPEVIRPARAAVPSRGLAVRRRGVGLELRARDVPDRCELAVEVCHGADILAVRHVGYEPLDDAARVEALLVAELEAMVAKIRRGGIDARLPTGGFVFVPPPLPPR